MNSKTRMPDFIKVEFDQYKPTASVLISHCIDRNFAIAMCRHWYGRSIDFDIRTLYFLYCKLINIDWRKTASIYVHLNGSHGYFPLDCNYTIDVIRKKLKTYREDVTKKSISIIQSKIQELSIDYRNKSGDIEFDYNKREKYLDEYGKLQANLSLLKTDDYSFSLVNDLIPDIDPIAICEIYKK